MSRESAIACIIGAVLSVIICLIIHFWDKVNKE